MKKFKVVKKNDNEQIFMEDNNKIFKYLKSPNGSFYTNDKIFSSYSYKQLTGNSKQLHDAIKKSNDNYLFLHFQILLDYGLDPNITYNDKPLLYYAIQNDNDALVYLLLKNGANPNFYINVDNEIINLFIDKKIKYLIVDENEKINIMFLNVIYGYRIDMLKIFLEFGGDINTKYNNMSMADCVLCQMINTDNIGYRDYCKNLFTFLVDNGCDTNQDVIISYLERYDEFI